MLHKNHPKNPSTKTTQEIQPKYKAWSHVCGVQHSIDAAAAAANFTLTQWKKGKWNRKEHFHVGLFLEFFRHTAAALAGLSLLCVHKIILCGLASHIFKDNLHTDRKVTHTMMHQNHNLPLFLILQYQHLERKSCPIKNNVSTKVTKESIIAKIP